MFTLANSIAISMSVIISGLLCCKNDHNFDFRYVIGFCESILDLCNAKIDGFTGIIDGGVNDVR